MPVEETTNLNITCDNPACPGNTLDPADRTDWLFISGEVYGQPVANYVFCSPECLSAGATTASGFTKAEPEAE